MRRASSLLVMCALACGTDQGRLETAGASAAILADAIEGAQNANAPPPTFAQWEEAMMATPLPDVGCFDATFPVPGWKEVACAVPEEEYLFDIGGPPPGVGPYAFRTSTNPTFTSVEGSFRTSGLTTTNQYDSKPRSTHGGPKNWFSVQLNTNHYSTSNCSSGGPGCMGIQQFVYENHGTGGGQICHQYWLTDFGPGGCPSGFGHPSGYPNHCYKTNWGPTVNSHTITILDKVKLTGKITYNILGQAVDGVYLITNDQNISVKAVEASSGLNGQWTEADFNVYGHDGGSGAIFANGSNIEVYMFFSGISYVPGDGWFWAPKTHTGEYNNLNMSGLDSAATLSNYGFVEHLP